MRNFANPSLATPNTLANRLVGIAGQLTRLAVVLAAASNVYAEISFTEIGDPAFEIVGHATVASPLSHTEHWDDLDDIFGPSNLVVEGAGVVPVEPINISIDEHVRREVAASGRINTNVFAVEEIFWERNWTSLLNLSPTSPAPTGSSPQSPNGPIIPNDIFPLTHQFKLYQNGSQVWTSPKRKFSSLASAGSQTLDDGTEIDFTESSFRDLRAPRRLGRRSRTFIRLTRCKL